jgi:hypothetical protein
MKTTLQLLNELSDQVALSPLVCKELLQRHIFACTEAVGKEPEEVLIEQTPVAPEVPEEVAEEFFIDKKK